jgi:hypothetical protein
MAPFILTEILPNNSRQPEDMGYLKLLGQTAMHKMEKCGIGQQQLLQLKIDALQFEADKIQQMIKQ